VTFANVERLEQEAHWHARIRETTRLTHVDQNVSVERHRNCVRWILGKARVNVSKALNAKLVANEARNENLGNARSGQLTLCIRSLHGAHPHNRESKLQMNRRTSDSKRLRDGRNDRRSL